MKVKFVAGISGMSGRMGEFVFCIEKKSGAVWFREYVKPRETEHNHTIGSIGQNLGVFWKSVSEGYSYDLKDYADRYNLATLGYSGRVSCYTVLTRMMYALKVAVPDVDLKTITPQDVVDMDLPVKTVYEAIENGLLAPVKREQQLMSFII